MPGAVVVPFGMTCARISGGQGMAMVLERLS